MNGAFVAGQIKSRSGTGRAPRKDHARAKANAAMPVAAGIPIQRQRPQWMIGLVRFAAAHALWLQIGTLLLLTVIVYGNTLDVPFYLDDFPSIAENPSIYMWDHHIGTIISQNPLRWITYLSFALNYQFNRFQPYGYHIVNIAIHAINGFLVFWLVRTIFETPKFVPKDHPYPAADLLPDTAPSKAGAIAQPCWTAFFAGALFVVHPLNTQAVTYIVQRAASLAALFYLASMLGYLQARIASSFSLRVGWATFCLIAMLLAFFTKQNTVTLPLALVLMELLFWKTNRRKILLIAFGFFLCLFCTWAVFSRALHLDPFSLQSMAEISRETKSISRWAYFMTQFRVLWTYLGLFLYPVGQCIDYQGYPIYQDFWQTAVLYSFLGHVLLVSFGIWCIRAYPMAAFGIFFYYLAHLVESSVLPIRDVVFEHRAYLPNVGLCIVAGWVFAHAYPKMTTIRGVRFLGVMVILLLAIAASARNQLWRDPIALWHQNAEAIPENKRAWRIYGKLLIMAGRYEEGANAIQNRGMVRMGNGDGQVFSMEPETLLNLVVANIHLKRYEQAKELIDYGFTLNMSPLNRSKLWTNYANMMQFQGRMAESEAYYREAIREYPPNLAAKINLANLLVMLRRLDEAEAIYREILEIEPGNEHARRGIEFLREMKTTDKAFPENLSQ